MMMMMMVSSGSLPANESLMLLVLHLSWLGMHYRVLLGSLPVSESLMLPVLYTYHD